MEFDLYDFEEVEYTGSEDSTSDKNKVGKNETEISGKYKESIKTEVNDEEPELSCGEKYLVDEFNHTKTNNQKPFTKGEESFKSVEKPNMEEEFSLENVSNIKIENVHVKIEDSSIQGNLLDNQTDNNCQICKKSFSARKSLTVHYTDVHNQLWTFACGICNKTYQTESAKNIHEKKHGVEGSTFQCEICQQDYVSQRQLIIHVKNAHALKKEYSCQLCDRQFAEIKEKTVHERKHMGLNPFECETCKKFFKTSSGLKSHIADIHEKNGSYACRYCDRKYYNESQRIDHERKHTGLKPFTCDKCGKSYDRKSTLNKHVKIHEPKSEESQEKHFCEVCFKMFSRRRRLKEHVSFVHEGGTSNICKICSKAYSKKESLERHIKDVHEARERPRLHECQTCLAAFFDERTLSRHVKVVHQKEKNWTCNICFKAFGLKGGLTRHIIDVHEQSGDHACSFCVKKFKLLVDKKRHELKHTKEKPYQCEFCPVKVGQRGTLNAHIKLKHPNPTTLINQYQSENIVPNSVQYHVTS